MYRYYQLFWFVQSAVGLPTSPDEINLTNDWNVAQLYNVPALSKGMSFYTNTADDAFSGTSSP
jgi:hypothetical protein